MKFWKQWSEPGLRLMAMFLLVATMLAGTLLWLGWKLARQDREVAAQRLQERREDAADLAVAALQKSLARADEQLTTIAALPVSDSRRKAADWAAALATGSVLVVERLGEFEAWPEKRLPFYPAVPANPAPASAAFVEADSLEFRQEDYAKALAILGGMARSNEPGTRVGAWLRMARICRKQNRWSDALKIYDQIAATGGQSEGLPVEAIARQARLSVFEHQQQTELARREAVTLLVDLEQRKWRLTRGAYEFYAAEARRVLGAASGKEDPAFALAAAVESLADDWHSSERPAGRRLLRGNGPPFLGIWRRSGASAVALILGTEWLQAQLNNAPRQIIGMQGVAIGLTDVDGRKVFGGQMAELARQSVRLASATQLPWNLHAVSTGTGEVSAAADTRQHLLITALGVITFLILAGAYLIGRAVTREFAVSKLESDFVSAVSHEFRTPLTSLCLLTEQLAEGKVGDETDRAEYYGVLARETQRLRRLVEGLLNFGRMEAGASEYKFDNLDPAELVSDVARNFGREVDSRGYRVEVRVDADTPLVRADRAALTSAVWNLLDNAVKYSPECPTVWAEAGRDDSGRAAIRVRDHGPGIPAAEQRRIFEKFVRGETAKQSAVRGTGVGLAMVQHIVAAHRGEIRLETKAGEGSTFTILLPALS